MKDAFDTGMNRTGIARSPVEAKKTVEGAQEGTQLEPPGEHVSLRAIRLEAAKASTPMGQMPPPASVKGAVKTAVTALKGEKANVLIDKLGERLAFERMGTRIYELALLKADAFPSWEGGPSQADLVDIHEEELEHFGLLIGCLETLGADPTAMTPSAAIAQSLSKGVPAVLADPRTDLRQCVDGLLVAELTDNACWEALILLAREAGQDAMADLFEAALAEEKEHLIKVRAWATAGLSAALERKLPSKPSTEAEAPA